MSTMTVAAAALAALALTDTERTALASASPHTTSNIPQGRHSVDITTRTSGEVRKGVDHRVCQTNQVLTLATLRFALECMSIPARRKFVQGILDQQNRDIPLPIEHKNPNVSVDLGKILGACDRPRTGMTNRYTNTRIVPTTTLFDESSV